MLIAAISIGGALSGCAEGDPRGEEIIREDPVTSLPEFTPPEFEEGRELDTLFAVNLDADTMPEYVVTSLAVAERFPQGVRADRLEIWDLDPASNTWRPALSDTLLWLDSLYILDMTDDAVPEVVALTFAGGNDEVAGRGGAIYSGHTPPIRTIFSRGGGMPRVVSFDGRRFLLLHTQHWPEFLPHAAAVPIPEELLTFGGGRSRSDFERSQGYFRQLAVDLRKRIDEILDARGGPGTGDADRLLEPAEATELYSLVIQTILTLRMAGDEAGLEQLKTTTLPRLNGLLEEEQAMMIEDEIEGN